MTDGQMDRETYRRSDVGDKNAGKVVTMRILMDAHRDIDGLTFPALSF